MERCPNMHYFEFRKNNAINTKQYEEYTIKLKDHIIACDHKQCIDIHNDSDFTVSSYYC